MDIERVILDICRLIKFVILNMNADIGQLKN